MRSSAQRTAGGRWAFWRWTFGAGLCTLLCAGGVGALQPGVRLSGHVADLDGVAIPGKEPGITLTVKGADGVEEDVPLEW